MSMDREQARDYVKGLLPDYLRSKGIDTEKNFKCLNPEHNDTHPSMSYYYKNNRCMCFSCGARYDIFDLIGIDYGLTDNKDIFKKAYELYNVEIDKTNDSKHNEGDKKSMTKEAPKEEKPKDEKPKEDYREKYNTWMNALPGSPAEEYLTQRGISLETARSYHIGYIPEYPTTYMDENGATSPAKWRVLIIPVTSASYTARNIDPAEPVKKNRYRKKGGSNIYKSSLLGKSDKPIIVVEGEFDVLSIWEAGGIAVGIGSVNNVRNFIELVKQDKNKPQRPLILSLDHDEPGQEAEDKLAEELEALGIPFYRRSNAEGSDGDIWNITGECKDANELLLKDRERLQDNIASAYYEIRQIEESREAEKEREYLKRSNLNFITAFDEFARNKPPVISTGFQKLDSLIDGGLSSEVYVIGAIPSLGKSTFVLQMAENIASAGTDVIIFSEEMGRFELMAKSFSRLMYMQARDAGDKIGEEVALSSREIFNGQKYIAKDQSFESFTDKERERLNAAKIQYIQYAGRIIIYPGDELRASVNDIREKVAEHITFTGRKPVVCVDYLQILRFEDTRETQREKVDRTVSEIKNISVKFDIPMIVISSLNRDNYKNEASLEAMKESGGIEYGSDTVWGLQLKGVKDSSFDVNEAKARTPREIELVILKQRNGITSQKIEFQYLPRYNVFLEGNIIRATNRSSGFITPSKEESAEIPFNKKRYKQR